MQDTMKFWDGIAQKYARSPIRDVPAYEYTLGRTQSYLRAQDTVLELGCGTGSTALRLAGSAAQITATDVSDKMLDAGRANAAEQGCNNVYFLRAEISEITEGPFDVVMAFNLMHLVEDTKSALDHVHQLLKPGGLFISKTPCQPEGRAPWGYRLIRVALPVMQFLGKAPFVKFMRAGDWDAEIRSAGFEILETGDHPANPPNHYVVARKL